MQIRKFRVSNMSEGLAAIRREVGNDAVVLSATKVTTEAGLTELEIAVAVNGRAAELTEAPPVAQPAAGGEIATLRDIVSALTEQIASLRSEVRSLRVEQHMMVKPETAAAAPERSRAARPAASAPALSLAMFGARDAEGELARAFSLSYQVLVSSGVLEAHAEDVLIEAFGALGKERTPQALFEALEQGIARRLDVASPLWHGRAAQRQVVVMLGPTGVGKTTTVAKIAGKAKFLGGRKVALIGADTFRIGGLFQLESYAELLDIPLLRARTENDLRSALAELADYDLVLVDTAGRNPWGDDAHIGLADPVFAGLRGGDDEVILTLCLSATTRTADLVAMVERYEAIAPDALVVTKLDEARGLGAVLSASVASGVPISHVCTGQIVPDDIEDPAPRRLAGWIRRGQRGGDGPRLAESAAARGAAMAANDESTAVGEALHRR